jgi:shikimate kinase
MLAAALNRSFLDFDAEITHRLGMSVPEIFGQRGEGHFRDLERGLTEEVVELGNMVLAPGGGWVTRVDNVALLRPPAQLIYLRVSPNVAMLRIGGSTTSRPLLNRPDPRGELVRLLSARMATYESADLVVDVDKIDAKEVTSRILGLLKGRH